MTRAVDLEEEPRSGHTVAPAPLAGRAAGLGGKDTGLGEDAAQGPLCRDEPLEFTCVVTKSG